LIKHLATDFHQARLKSTLKRHSTVHGKRASQHLVGAFATGAFRNKIGGDFGQGFE